MGTTLVTPKPNIVDGFSFNDQLIYLPGRYFPLALAEFDTLRRANNYRARWIVVPDNLDEPIQGYDTFYYQAEIAAGSFLWGYKFASLSATAPDGSPAETTASDLLWKVTDSCTEVPLQQDYANAGGSRPNGNSRCFPVLVSPPRLILAPGLLNIEIANRTANAINCQLVLEFAEKCQPDDTGCPPGWTPGCNAWMDR